MLKFHIFATKHSDYDTFFHKFKEYIKIRKLRSVGPKEV